MTTRTFQYTGPHKSFYVETRIGNVEFDKGSKFSTDDEVVARRLLEEPDIKEITKDEKADDKKPSRAADARP